MVDNPSFALPYWDWDSPDAPGCDGSHLQLPVPYQSQYVHGSDGPVNPLWDANRGVGAEEAMCAALVGNARLDVVTTLYDTFPLFFGTAECGSALWHGAHGYIHIWTGGLINAEDSNGPMALSCPDMGMLGTAARDPLSYSHHANVDRIWDVWIAKNGEPDYPREFLEQSWSFWVPGPGGIEEPVLIEITGADGAQRTERMHYRYAEPSCDADAPVRLMPEATTPLHAQGTSFQTVAKPSYTMNGKTGSKVVLHFDQSTTTYRPVDRPASRGSGAGEGRGDHANSRTPRWSATNRRRCRACSDARWASADDASRPRPIVCRVPRRASLCRWPSCTSAESLRAGVPR